MTSPLLLAQGLLTQVGQRLHGQGSTVNLGFPSLNQQLRPGWPRPLLSMLPRTSIQSLARIQSRIWTLQPVERS